MGLKSMTYLNSAGKAFSLLLLALSFAFVSAGQTEPVYTFRNGKMCIELEKNISARVLNEFITQYNLNELDLNNFLKTGNPDSLHKLGWQVELDAANRLRLIKAFEAFGNDHISADRILFNGNEPLFPSTGNGLVFGINRFVKKNAFTFQNGEVTFFLRGNASANEVMLAGSFNSWSPTALRMTKTDSGWIANVKLTPGKWWYKFIVDGRWIVDPDNLQKENDGVGNINSVYFLSNVTFRTSSFNGAKQVFVAGSFNDWDPKQLAMQKTADGWSLPIYLADGTHSYKFVVDGKWYTDEASKEKLPDGVGGMNSVIKLGKAYVFKLEGYEHASRVFVAGSFNDWRSEELKMTKVSDGWELPYSLGAGNHEFKFIVDGKDVLDGSRTTEGQNFFVVIQPNHEFKLNGFADAMTVYVAGDFNGWNPAYYALKKQGDQWVLPLHLPAGKHLYKFIVDGKWILDPANKLWEENEHNTGNSILWIEK